jgi:hypothetical protein
MRAPRERTIVLLLALAVAAHALAVVKDFGGPLIAAGDANYFEYLGHYVADHLRWGLPLRLDFVTDEVAYPHGTSIVYLSWCAERDLLHALFLKGFGPGPWIQLYVAASDFLTAFGAYVLLRREVGPARAGLVGFAASVMTFYASFKFAYHLNLCALHWATMSIVVDWLIVRRVVARRRLSALLVLLRVTLLGLTVGLDIAYVAGFALLSFTMTTLFVLAALAKGKRALLRELLPERPLAEARARPAVFGVWLALLALACVAYVPFDLAVVRGSFIYDFHGAGGNFWSNQLRIFFPYFPGVHPGSQLFSSIVGDADGVGELSPGWALLVAGVWGLVAAWRDEKLAVFAPLLATFALSFAFHPTRFPTLHLFPWFKYDRVAGRATIFFPLFFALFALGLAEVPRLWARIVAPLAAIEVLTAYALVDTYRPVRAAESAPILAYERAVRRAPGAALLSWPMCIAGANGAGTEELCPYYTKLSTAYSYRRFHHKKVPDFYLSRTHATQLAPWLEAGWPRLFSPDVKDAHRATHETRCFDEEGWAMFTRFYASNDFAGLQLYADLEPPECVAEFHARFGQPTAEVSLPGIGRTEFIPRAPRPAGP